jgi:hypothetical protein
MNFRTIAADHLVPFPSDSLLPVDPAGSEAWEEDILAVSSLDLRTDSFTDQHGSFEWLPSITFSITSTESQDTYTTAFEDALAACLTREEAAQECPQCGIESHRWKLQQYPHRGRPRRFYFGHPWIAMETCDSSLFYACKGQARTPTVESGRADRNWRVEPRLYNARVQKSFLRSASTPTTKQDKKNQKKDKKTSRITLGTTVCPPI